MIIVKRFPHCVLVAASALLLAASWLPATAAALPDALVTSGYGCQELAGSGKKALGAWGTLVPNPLISTVAAYAGNVGGVPIDVYCPIVRHNTTMTTGMASLKMYVLQSPGDLQANKNGVTCTAYSVKSTGQVVQSVSPVWTTTTGTPVQTLTFSLTQSAANGNYFIKCTVAALAGILTIHSEEK